MITKYVVQPYQDVLTLINGALEKEVPFSAIYLLTFILMFSEDYFYYDGEAVHFPKHEYSKQANKEDLDNLVLYGYIAVE